MTPVLILAAIVVVPILLALILRVSAPLLFLSIAVGVLLQRTLGDSMVLALAAIVKDGPVEVVANAVLLGLPIVLTFFFLRKSLRSKELPLQVIPIVAAGLALGMVVLPLLPGSTQDAIYAQQFGAQLRRSGDLLIAIAAIVNLMLAWRLYRYPKADNKHSS